MQRFQRGYRGNFRGNDRGGRGGRGRGDRKREWINPTERYGEDEPPVILNFKNIICALCAKYNTYYTKVCSPFCESRLAKHSALDSGALYFAKRHSQSKILGLLHTYAIRILD